MKSTKYHDCILYLTLYILLDLYSLSGRKILPQDLVKSRSHEIRVQIFPIALKFDRYLGSSAAEMPVKYQNDTINITCNLVALRLHEIWR